METAFITGGLGLIGGFIARKLIDGDIVDKVVLLDHYGSYIDPTRNIFTDYRKLRLVGIEDRVIIERGEVRYYAVLSRLLEKYKPKYIYHLAALPLAKLDNLNAQDPLQLTEGVKALLTRYYFLNNSNIWLWGLYENDDLRGMEKFKTFPKTFEWGGRYQTPVPLGEMAVSIHHRQVDLLDLSFRSQNSQENRIALDGSWDLGVGLWFESVAKQTDALTESWQKTALLGIDYTFAVGSGLHGSMEHTVVSESEELLSAGQSISMTAIALNYSMNILDSVMTILNYGWQQDEWSSYWAWQRTYDDWLLSVGVFSKGEDPGVQLMWAMYH